MRDKVDILIALGTCATDGGIPRRPTCSANDDIFEKVFRDCPTHDAAGHPKTDVIPFYTDNVMALDEVVEGGHLSFRAARPIRTGSPTPCWRSSTGRPSGPSRSGASATPAR